MFLTSASKFNIEPNGGIFDVSAENDCVSPNVKTPESVHDEHGFLTRDAPGASSALRRVPGPATPLPPPSPGDNHSRRKLPRRSLRERQFTPIIPVNQRQIFSSIPSASPQNARLDAVIPQAERGGRWRGRNVPRSGRSGRREGRGRVVGVGGTGMTRQLVVVGVRRGRNHILWQRVRVSTRWRRRRGSGSRDVVKVRVNTGLAQGSARDSLSVSILDKD